MMISSWGPIVIDSPCMSGHEKLEFIILGTGGSMEGRFPDSQRHDKQATLPVNLELKSIISLSFLHKESLKPSNI